MDSPAVDDDIATTMALSDVEGNAPAENMDDDTADEQSDVLWTTDDDNDGAEDDDDGDSDEGEGNEDAIGLAALEEEVGSDDEDDENQEFDGDTEEAPATAPDPPSFEVNDHIEESKSPEVNDRIEESKSPEPSSLPSSGGDERTADEGERPRSKTTKQRHPKAEQPVEGREKTPDANKPSSSSNKSRRKSVVNKDIGGSAPRDGLFKKERDMLALSMKKMRAIRRKAPVQVRIWTEPRNVKTPMDNYACAIAEAVCNDIFWSAMKNDMVRLKHLVHFEGISVHTTLDPWMFHQTPLHWAAKGGAVEAIDYLVARGADVHKKDDNGSIPLHLACWAGHTNAAIALLRAGDLKDLLIADYDANLNALEWAGVRQHIECIASLNKFCDSVWLPVFVAELIWKIVSKTKMRTFEEKKREEQVALERAEMKRLTQLAEQAKQAAQIGQAVVLDGSDAAKVTFSTQSTDPKP